MSKQQPHNYTCRSKAQPGRAVLGGMHALQQLTSSRAGWLAAFIASRQPLMSEVTPVVVSLCTTHTCRHACQRSGVQVSSGLNTCILDTPCPELSCQVARMLTRPSALRVLK